MPAERSAVPNWRAAITVHRGLAALFGLLMAFSAVAYLTKPEMAQAFEHLGFPPYFRIELAIAKLIGVATLLSPVPERFKEWAYAGFGITLISAVIAHSSIDGPSTAVAPFVVFVLLAAVYATRCPKRATSYPDGRES